MLSNYFKTALRSLLKSKFFTILNLAGLSLGLIAGMLILLYVHNEHTYDQFLKDSDQLYRVQLDRYINDELSISSAESFPGIGPVLQEEFESVEAYARLYNMGYKNNIVITWENPAGDPIKFKHRKFLYADASFLPMMGYEVVAGSLESALKLPNTAVLTESMAKKYFGDAPAIGKMIRLQDDDFNDELCEVTAVLKDLPQNTHLKFDVLFSYSTLFSRGDWAPERYGSTWERKDMYTYLKLKKGSSVEQLSAQFPPLFDLYNPELKEQNRRDEIQLQAVTDIHLHSNLAEEPEANGNAMLVNFLGVLGIIVLVIAWINYVNLSTAHAMDRATEVGVRKVMGAFKNQLIFQFLTESLLINLMAIVLSIVSIWFLLPVFNEFTGLNFIFLEIITVQSVGVVVAIWIIGSLLSGLYPAFALSAFKPVKVLKGKFSNSGGASLLRKILVTIQFTSSGALIIGTIIVYSQVNFLLNQDIGMDISQVLVVERPGISSEDRNEFMANVDAFRAEILQSPNIESVSGSLTIPGKKREYKAGVKPFGSNNDKLVTLRLNSMDYSFIETFGMELLAGRGFSEAHNDAEVTRVVLSKKASELLGYNDLENIIGEKISIPAFQMDAEVVGVVNDYAQESLKKSQDPMIFYFNPYGVEFYSMKLNSDNITPTLAHIESVWNKVFEGNPMDYFFLDDYFNRQYQAEQRFGSLFGVFAVMAIVVGCLGLFGLTAHTVRQKTKEMSVRKVLGASEVQVFIQLTQNLIALLLLSIVLSSGTMYYIMNYWLNTFATKIELPLWAFAAAGATLLGVALATISVQTIRAAKINPAISLKSE